MPVMQLRFDGRIRTTRVGEESATGERGAEGLSEYGTEYVGEEDTNEEIGGGWWEEDFEGLGGGGNGCGGGRFHRLRDYTQISSSASCCKIRSQKEREREMVDKQTKPILFIMGVSTPFIC